MPRGRRHKRPVSRAQARFFGAAAGGLIPGFSSKDARDKLRGVKMKNLPARASSGSKRRRGGRRRRGRR